MGFLDFLGFGKDGTSAANTIGDNAGYKNINALAGATAGNADLQNALMQVLNPNTSSKYAGQQVIDNPLFAGMFGKGGYQSKLQNEEGDLSQNGYSLTPQDHEAYGQASDDAARMFGQQGNQVSSMLAQHGLAAGGSGAGGVAFSGLAGNQNEQLAAAQRNIANDRMNMNLNRLNSVRGAINNTQAQAQNALNSQQDNNQRAVDNYNNIQQNSLHAGESNQNQLNNQWEQQQSSKTATFGDMLGGALANGLGSYSGSAGTAGGKKAFGQSGGGASQAGAGGSAGSAGGMGAGGSAAGGSGASMLMA